MMSTIPVNPLITAKEALEFSTSESLLGKVVFIDGSYHMGGARDTKADFLKSHIPGARLFEIDEVCDKSIELPHMCPTEAIWTNAMNSFGIKKEDHVILYTHPGSVGGPRVWYLFKAFQHEKVSLINGGLDAWVKEGGKVESATTMPSPVTAEELTTGGYIGAKLLNAVVANKGDVLEAVNSGMAQILDARSSQRFTGQAAEPRAGLISGSIPGSLNLPFTELVEGGDTTRFKSKEEIRDVLRASGVIFGAKCISTCGSGLTAAYAAMGASIIGRPFTDMPIYDGSWTEWGKEGSDTPKQTKEDFL